MTGTKRPGKSQYNSSSSLKAMAYNFTGDLSLDKPFVQCRTVVFGEFECSGSGANTTGRVPWLKRFTFEEIRPFLDLMFVNGEQWLRL